MGVNALKILSVVLFPSLPSLLCSSYCSLHGSNVFQRFHGLLQVKYWGCPDPCSVDAYGPIDSLLEVIYEKLIGTKTNDLDQSINQSINF